MRMEALVGNLSNAGTIATIFKAGGAAAGALTTSPVAITALLASWLGAPCAEYLTRSSAKDDAGTIAKRLPDVVSAASNYRNEIAGIGMNVKRLRERGYTEWYDGLNLRLGGPDFFSKKIESTYRRYCEDYTRALDETQAAVNALERATSELKNRMIELEKSRASDKRLLETLLQEAKNLERDLNSPSMRQGR